MSEEYSDNEDEFRVESKHFLPSREFVPLDAILSAHEVLVEYTQALGLPLLNSRGSGLHLYELIQSKTQ